MYVYAALGDSITAGRDASSPRRAYPAVLAQLLGSRRIPVQPMVLARSGWTSGQLAAALSSASASLSLAQAATVWIGANDLIEPGVRLIQGQRASLASVLGVLDRNLSRILYTVRRAGVSRIVCCTQYNPFPNSPVAAAFAQLNQTIRRAAVRAGCAVAPADFWFAGREQLLIAGYRSGKIEEVLTGRAAVHPNDEGHRVIASGLLPFLS